MGIDRKRTPIYRIGARPQRASEADNHLLLVRRTVHGFARRNRPGGADDRDRGKGGDHALGVPKPELLQPRARGSADGRNRVIEKRMGESGGRGQRRSQQGRDEWFQELLHGVLTAGRHATDRRRGMPSSSEDTMQK